MGATKEGMMSVGMTGTAEQAICWVKISKGMTASVSRKSWAVPSQVSAKKRLEWGSRGLLMDGLHFERK